MIRIELDVMLARRKMTLTELSRRLDIALPNLSILKNGHAKAIRMALLDALCRELDCQLRTPLSKITSTGEIEQRFRLN